jgi:hypothetical protein
LKPGTPHLASSLVVGDEGEVRGHFNTNCSGIVSMKMSLPDKMFADPEQSRLSILRNWVLDHDVTEIQMSERQFWNFAQLQPVAEKPWVTFMGRRLRVPNMPDDAQKCIGIFDGKSPGAV